jgi:hypothetical protein
MTFRLFSGAVCLLVGLAYILIPWFIFPICERADRAAEPAAQSHAQSHDHAQAADRPMASGVAQGSAQGAGASAGHDRTHMVCWHMAKAELGVGILALWAAAVLVTSRTHDRRAGALSLTAGLAVLGGLLPAALIGVCPGPSMPCRVGTLPALMVLSAFFFLFSLVAGVWSAKAARAAQAAQAAGRPQPIAHV